MKFVHIKISSRSFLVLSVIFGVVALFAACADSQGVKPVNTAADNTAIRGFDTVAFFTDEKLTEGKRDFVHEWNGARWHFASAENLEKFKNAPEKYAPQFGGYCSYAVSHGYTADGDPATWKIAGGRLYLNYNQKAKDLWEKEQEKFIDDGERNWQEFLVKKPKHEG